LTLRQRPESIREAEKGEMVESFIGHFSSTCKKFPSGFDLISSHAFCGTGLVLNLSGLPCSKKELKIGGIRGLTDTKRRTRD
jgi:hypothetical protein